MRSWRRTMSPTLPKPHIKLLLSDDHRIVSRGIRLILERARGLRVVSEAESAAAALSMIPVAQPDGRRPRA